MSSPVTEPATARSTNRISIGPVPIDVTDFDGALERVEQLVDAKLGGTVFTPNVDHIVMADADPRFRRAYEHASLSLVDGMPVLWASRLLKTPLPEKISGSDLVWPLMRLAARRGYRVFLLGGDEGVAELAKRRFEAELPGLMIVGTDGSHISVDAVDEALIARIRAAKPDIVLLALGAPKQELFAHEQRDKLAPAVCIGIGASLDFVAGTKSRAPRWMSRSGLEWLFRLAQEPGRLGPRYLLRGPRFLGILARQAIGAAH